MTTMDLPPPTVIAAQSVISLPRTLPFAPALDEQLIAALAAEFPNLLFRQTPLAAPVAAEGPRLVMGSTSSQLVIAQAQADFQVRFYGDFPSDPERCLSYTQKKLEAVRAAFAALEIQPNEIGVVLQCQFSFNDLDTRPTDHILATHLRGMRVDPAVVSDTVARVAVEVRDKYFVMLRVADYETRRLERTVMPQAIQQPILIRSWEGEVQDIGVSLTIDINSRLESRNLQRDPVITEQGIAAVIDLTRHSLADAGPTFVETGEVNVASLVEEPA
jgi:hypothetical protein